MSRIAITGVLSLMGTLAGALLIPPAAAGHQCLAPNGSDDTAVLQAALEGCSGATDRCVVSLCEGLFHIAPVRVGDFRGVLKGAGRDETVIQALPELVVNDTPIDYNREDPLESPVPWPFLVQFIGGKAKIRDFTIEIPTPEPGQRPTTGWLDGMIFELDGALLLTGLDPVDFDVDRIRVVAGNDPLSDFFNTTLLNGVFFQGRLFDPTDSSLNPVHPVKGRYSLSDSDFEGMLSGRPVAETDRARVTIKHNRYRSGFAMHVQDAHRSRILLLKNRWETEFVGVQFLLNVDGDPSERNSIIALGNRGSTQDPSEDFAIGIFFVDPWVTAREAGDTKLILLHNRISVDGVTGPAFSGIDVVGAGRLIAWRNTVRGEASLGGINVDSTSGCKLISNSLGTEGGPDLVLGAATSECLTFVGRHDVVLDEGTNNRIIRR